MNKHLRIATHLVNLLENRFQIFGWKFGLDPLLGLIPGIGDIVSTVISGYLIWIGIQMRIPQEKIVKMLRNLAIDLAIGSLPVIGDVADFAYKANTKNLRILMEEGKREMEIA